jgi:hypothetical protein
MTLQGNMRAWARLSAICFVLGWAGPSNGAQPLQPSTSRDATPTIFEAYNFTDIAQVPTES